jgi:CO dehydrogenase nickel-insertion accessory protein CooC1
MAVKVWSISKLAENIRKRQLNFYDCNISVTGATGSGKSTFVAKLLYRVEGFKPEKHMVFDRDSVINLIQSQKFGIAWDDEAIGTSYKRQFQNAGQQQLIKTVAMYRSNFNLYIAVLPEFYSLDKDI